MRLGIGFFVHVNPVAFGHPQTEFLLYRLLRIVEQPCAKGGVFRGSREEAFRRGGGFLHRCRAFPWWVALPQYSAIKGPAQTICLLTSSLNAPSTSMRSLNDPLWTTFPACIT